MKPHATKPWNRLGQNRRRKTGWKVMVLYSVGNNLFGMIPQSTLPLPRPIIRMMRRLTRKMAYKVASEPRTNTIFSGSVSMIPSINVR